MTDTTTNKPTVIDHFDGIAYRWLSNFFDDDGNTVEHHYQAAKTNSIEHRAAILAAPTPHLAKKLGRRCPIRENWDNEKIPVMRALLSNKFAHGTELAAALLDTGDAELIEGNHWGDTFWGVCDGNGTNWLGRLLMEQRDTLRALAEPNQQT